MGKKKTSSAVTPGTASTAVEPASAIGEGEATGAALAAPAETPAPAAPAPKKAKADGPITVTYRDHKGEPAERTFSKEVHGEDFATLADEFKATNASRLIA